TLFDNILIDIHKFKSLQYQEVFLSKEEHLFFCTNLQQHVQSSIPEKSSFPVLCKINIFPIRL
ncbi:hypothetical protein, partial [Phocaeicola plebeius]|uniref:hypothetical protein n=1 Tax=Phocaeicola plebeius TaxID=310297 RepID=UPI0026EA806B